MRARDDQLAPRDVTEGRGETEEPKASVLRNVFEPERDDRVRATLGGDFGGRGELDIRTRLARGELEAGEIERVLAAHLTSV